MKLDILIVDFALVAAVFVPYFLFILIGRKENGELKLKLSELIKKHQLNLTQKDHWNNNIMGLDKEKAIIILVQKRRVGVVTEIIALNRIGACEIFQEVQEVIINRRKKPILQKIDLQLKMHDGSIQTISLYNCDETYLQDYELQHAERWNRTINELIVFRPTLNSVA